MFEILNVVVALALTLLNTKKYRDNMNSQGQEWIKYFRFKKRQEKDEKKYDYAIKAFQRREVILNKDMKIGQYVITTVIILSIMCSIMYGLSIILNTPGVVAVICVLIMIFSSALLLRYAKSIVPNEDGGEIILIVSVFLSIPLLIRKWDLGLYVLTISILQKTIWFDFAFDFKKRMSRLTESFKGETAGLVIRTSFSLVAYYLILYWINTIFSHGEFETVGMICTYVVLFSSTSIYGSGMKIVGEASKKVLREEMRRGDQSNKKLTGTQSENQNEK